MPVADSLLCEKGGRRRIRVRERPTPSVDDRGRACRAEATIVQVLGIVYRAISTFLPRSACRLEGERRVRIAWPRLQRSGGASHVSPQRRRIRIGRTTHRLTWLRRYPPARSYILRPVMDGTAGGPKLSAADLLSNGPRVVNVGLPRFAEDLRAVGVPVADVAWTPPASADNSGTRSARPYHWSRSGADRASRDRQCRRDRADARRGPGARRRAPGRRSRQPDSGTG